MKINKGTFHLGDCMDLMKDIEDNYYELAIVNNLFIEGGG